MGPLSAVLSLFVLVGVGFGANAHSSVGPSYSQELTCYVNDNTPRPSEGFAIRIDKIPLTWPNVKAQVRVVLERYTSDFGEYRREFEGNSNFYGHVTSSSEKGAQIDFSVELKKGQFRYVSQRSRAPLVEIEWEGRKLSKSSCEWSPQLHEFSYEWRGCVVACAHEVASPNSPLCPKKGRTTACWSKKWR